jgi:hypothetical protein
MSQSIRQVMSRPTNQKLPDEDQQALVAHLIEAWNQVDKMADLLVKIKPLVAHDLHISRLIEEALAEYESE